MTQTDCLPIQLKAWLVSHAEDLNRRSDLAEDLLPVLGQANVFAAGVPEALGGIGGDVRDAVQAIAAVAEYSLTAAFVFWGQRTFIEYLLQSPNEALREQELPRLLAGELAGATGLSNAMKFLSGIEALQITATRIGAQWSLCGTLPWVTNLRHKGFLVAAAVGHEDGSAPAILALSSAASGLSRSADLDLLALRASNTAAISIQNQSLGEEAIIHADALKFLPQVRPAFLGMQCGLSIGLARASLGVAQEQARASRRLIEQVENMRLELDLSVNHLLKGMADGRFRQDAASLFRLRIRLAEIVQLSLMLELQASGGRAYLQPQGSGFARRWLEAAFIPVVTPSITQLQNELNKYTQVVAA